MYSALPKSGLAPVVTPAVAQFRERLITDMSLRSTLTNAAFPPGTFARLMIRKLGRVQLLDSGNFGVEVLLVASIDSPPQSAVEIEVTPEGKPVARYSLIERVANEDIMAE